MGWLHVNCMQDIFHAESVAVSTVDVHVPTGYSHPKT